MDRWRNKVAIVTGASSGIGEAIAKDLVKAGVVVVALARRENRVQEIQKSLPENLQNHFHPVKCDVTKEDEVKKVFEWVDKTLGGIHILVNNAGVLRTTELIRPDNTQEIKETIDTNIWGVVFCTREAVNYMKARKIDGHVVIINSVAGHKVPTLGKEFPSLNIYPATKYAITAMTELYRQEFMNSGTKIKITSISPGAVATEIFPEEAVDTFKKEFIMLKSEDVSDAVLYTIGTPPHVQIHELIIKPIGEVF